MQVATCLVTVPFGKVTDILASLRTIPGVTHAVAVPAPYDIIVTIEAEDLRSVGGIVVDQIQKITKGINTVTLPHLPHPGSF